jgi:hypothetical protein
MLLGRYPHPPPFTNIPSSVMVIREEEIMMVQAVPLVGPQPDMVSGPVLPRCPPFKDGGATFTFNFSFEDRL